MSEGIVAKKKLRNFIISDEFYCSYIKLFILYNSYVLKEFDYLCLCIGSVFVQNFGIKLTVMGSAIAALKRKFHKNLPNR